MVIHGLLSCTTQRTNRTNNMKIKITHTVEIDAQKWANEYGIDIKDVKTDVAGYFKTFCDDHIEMLNLGKEAK